MRKNLVPIITILAVAIVLGTLVGWWATRTPSIENQPNVISASTEPETPGVVVASNTASTHTAAAQPAPVDPPPINANYGVNDQNWEEKLGDLLEDDKIDTDKKADILADMIGSVSEPAQTELAGHLVNLVPDDQYTKAANILKSEKTPAPVAQILLDDLFNRHDGLKLPLILSVAKNDKHPLKAEALDMLELATQEEHGTNWTEWQELIDKTLKENN